MTFIPRSPRGTKQQSQAAARAQRLPVPVACYSLSLQHVGTGKTKLDLCNPQHRELQWQSIDYAKDTKIKVSSEWMGKLLRACKIASEQARALKTNNS